MRLPKWIYSLGELGVKPGYLPWEKYITRNLNYVTLASIVALGMGIGTYACFGNYDFVKVHLLAMALLPFILVVNARTNYIWAMYTFHFFILFSIFMFTLKMGVAGGTYMFFVPLSINLLMLLRRKDIYKNVVVLFIMLFLFLVLFVTAFLLGWFQSHLPAAETILVRTINVSFSSALTLIVTNIVIQQNLKQEVELSSMVKEKETLLAEVNHRVRNNMNVITSLLNLKKDLCTTEEARDALEDCKNRVYSMALIHQKVYFNSAMKDVDFQEYITELAKELVSSYSVGHSIDLKIKADNCLLSLDLAVPCSLIINEVLTNSLKHAGTKDSTLELNVAMKQNGNNIELTITDNGPGLPDKDKMNKESLGMTLIELLCTQLEAKYSFTNTNGLEFSMSFALPKAHKV